MKFARHSAASRGRFVCVARSSQRSRREVAVTSPLSVEGGRTEGTGEGDGAVGAMPKSECSPDERSDIRDPTLPVQSRISLRSCGLLLPRMSGLVNAASSVQAPLRASLYVRPSAYFPRSTSSPKCSTDIVVIPPREGGKRLSRLRISRSSKTNRAVKVNCATASLPQEMPCNGDFPHIPRRAPSRV